MCIGRTDFGCVRMCFGLERDGLGDVIMGVLGGQLGFEAWRDGFLDPVGCAGALCVGCGD